FRREGGAFRSWSVAFTDRRLRDATLGTPLQLAPRRLQHRLVGELGMRVVRPYRCRTTCRGDAAFPGSRIRVGFGRVGIRPPYLVLYGAVSLLLLGGRDETQRCAERRSANPPRRSA